MAKTTYTAPEVPGSSRSSERPYTHAVVGRRNIAALRAYAPESAEYSHGKQTYDYYSKQVQVGAGNSYLYKTGECRPFMVTVKQEDYDRGVAFLAENPDRAAYVAKKLAERMAELGTEDAGPLQVLQWSMSHANADKATGTFLNKGYVGVRVVETAVAKVHGTRKAKAAA